MKLYSQLESAQLENLASDPTPASLGRIYYNTVTKVIRIYDGTLWSNIGSSSSAPVTGVTGTRASPTLITAVGGITPSGYGDELMFIGGNAAPIDVSADPQVAVGTVLGQTLELVGRDATNTVLLEDGAGLDLNGAWLAELGSILGLRWDGTNWCERYRR